MEKPKCSQCGSQFVYSRIRTNELVCRTCGHIESKGKKKGIKGKDGK